MNSSTISILNGIPSCFCSLLSDCYNYTSNWMQSFYSLLYSFITFKRLSHSALPEYHSTHTIHLLNNLKTESKLSLGSNTDFITAKSELLFSIDFDTNSFLNTFCQDNFGLNEIYKLIRWLITTFLSLPDEMVRDDKKFESDKKIASAFNNL